MGRSTAHSTPPPSSAWLRLPPSKQANWDGGISVAAEEAEGQEQGKVSVPLDREELCGLDGGLVRVVGEHEARQPERAGQREGHEEERRPGHGPPCEACRINAVARRHERAGEPRHDLGAQADGGRHLALPPIRLHLVVVAVEEDVRGREAEQGRSPGHQRSPGGNLRHGGKAEGPGRLRQEEGARRQRPEGEEAEDLSHAEVAQAEGGALVNVTDAHGSQKHQPCSGLPGL
mmetsp:Transcript_2393/g.6034  ORF Transcript_2393/g.6034 Transcript_2393/m.6034 type:complete len:232 (+) Transcript_2393:174-869(+)